MGWVSSFGPVEGVCWKVCLAQNFEKLRLVGVFSFFLSQKIINILRCHFFPIYQGAVDSMV